MRTHLDSLVTEKVLSIINDSVSHDLPLDDLPLSEGLPLKNVCAKVSSHLSEEIDKVCGFLGISKRRFLEAAFIDAVETANEIVRREGLYEVVQQVSGGAVE